MKFSYIVNHHVCPILIFNQKHTGKIFAKPQLLLDFSDAFSLKIIPP